MSFGQDDKSTATGVLGQVLDNAMSNAQFNQIRGINVANTAVGNGIPRQVTNVAASVSNATTGSTNVVTVTFRRDPADVSFSKAQVYLRGYNGNPSNVLIASGSNSPISFVLNNTGESIVVLVQSSGNAGDAPISSSPTTGVKLPKSTGGGFGPTTVTSSVTGLTGDVTTTGSSSPLTATVVGLQGKSLSAVAPNPGDVLEYSAYGASKWDVTGLWSTQHVCEFYMDATVTTWSSTGVNTANVAIPNITATGGSITAINPTATNPAVTRVTTINTANTNAWGWGYRASGSVNYWTLGTLKRFSLQARLANTTNSRYWFGLCYNATAPSGVAVYATDTPNANIIGFRYSAGTDSTIACVCQTDNTHQTVVSSGVSVDTSNLVYFEIAWDGTNAKFYINGALVATINTNVPATSQGIGPFFVVDNKNTANAITMDVSRITLSMK